jgi:spermidine synthase
MEITAAARRYLFLTVFIGGMSTLAIEFTASRMLQTVYGTSNIVWANVIGLVLFFLTLGYFLGGWLADRYPSPRLFYGLVSLAGFSGVFFLLLTSVILRTAAGALATINVGAVVSSLLGVAFALAVPVTLLGCISPFAIRLGIRDMREAGRISGMVYAISTWGSILGTYLPVLYLIPTAGSRWTAVIFGSLLLFTGLIGLWRFAGAVTTPVRYASFILPLLLVPPVVAWSGGNLKQYPGQIHEVESAYNYIQVVRQDGCNYLLLNEGQAYHSFYCDDDRIPRISVWTIMLAAPFFNQPDQVSVSNMAVIGLAAGTIPKQFTQVFGPLPVDGIEIDPEILTVGREHFALTEPNINLIVGDGRYQLNLLQGGYDIITIDAYKVPYIPWHMTTRQFFQEVKWQLTDNGVMAINVGRVPEDRRLVEAITATLLTVFPSVHTIDVPGSLNTILVATRQPTTADNLRANLALLDGAADPLLPITVQAAVDNLMPTVAGEMIFTDERSPVETIIDSIVIRFLLQEGPSALPGLGGG